MAKKRGKPIECSIEVGSRGNGHWVTLHTESPLGEFLLGIDTDFARCTRRGAIQRARNAARKFGWTVMRVFNGGDEG